jgi:two-component system sensor histidine kinase QseC
MNRSLQGRLLVLVIALVAAVWGAAALQTWFEVRHELDELLDSHLAQAAALLVVQQAGEIDDDAPPLDAPTLHRYAPKVAFQVFHEGRLAMRSANAPTDPMVTSAHVLENGFATVRLAGTRWRVFATTGAEHDVRVYVGEQIDSRAGILRAVLRSTLLPMAIALPLLALAVGWAVHRSLAPLRRMSSQLVQRQPQALDPLEVDGAPTEVQPMVTALNDLFLRIRTLMEGERRFTADAAHELRTPIAAIRAQAQVALGEADAAERRHALLATLEGCDRATRLVQQLLTLSRLEAGAAPVLTPLDLAALARREVAELASQGLARGQAIELEAEAPTALLVRGESTLLSVLLRNLIDNAIRYSPHGARIRLHLARRGAEVVLTVDDSGPGLADADLQRLGERFFRVIGSDQAGSGLGWSIVRRIAAVQGAQVQVGRSAALGGLAVTVAWPAA